MSYALGVRTIAVGSHFYRLKITRAIASDITNKVSIFICIAYGFRNAIAARLLTVEYQRYSQTKWFQEITAIKLTFYFKFRNHINSHIFHVALGILSAKTAAFSCS